MPLVIGLYDHGIKTNVLPCTPGTISIKEGTFYKLSQHWTTTVSVPGLEGANGKILNCTLDRMKACRYDVDPGLQNLPPDEYYVNISQGSVIWNARTREVMATQAEPIIEDTINYESTAPQYNTFFVGAFNSGTEQTPVPNYLTLQMTVNPTQEGDTSGDSGSIEFNVGSYVETVDEITGERLTYKYGGGAGGGAFNTVYNYQTFPNNGQFPFVTLLDGGKLFSDTDDEYFVFAFGVYGTISYFSTFSTQLLAIPKQLFKDKVPIPYSGDEPEDEKDSAFIKGDASNGKGSGRENYDANPYGIKGGVASDLVGLTQASFNQLLGAIYGRYWIESQEVDPVTGETITVETETTVSDQTLANIVNKMNEAIGSTVTWGNAQNAYQGSSSLGSDLLKLGSFGNAIGEAIVNGAGTRNSEIVQQMLDGILVCHLVPNVTGLVSGGATINRIAGVKIPSISALGLTSEIIELSFSVPAVNRRTNCYLDFEPFTTCTLHLPFVGEVNIDPSIAYYGVSGKYLIDIYTGGVSVEIYAPNTYADVGRESPVIVVKQGSCAVEMPIVGTGRNTKGAEKMVATLSSMATGGPMGAIAGLGTLLLEGQQMTMPSLVTKQSNPGVNCYLSPRSIYITMTIPKPANGSLFVPYHGYKWNGSGDLKYAGYYEVDEIRLDISAPQAVKEQIISRLREGVIVV